MLESGTTTHLLSTVASPVIPHVTHVNPTDRFSASDSNILSVGQFIADLPRYIHQEPDLDAMLQNTAEGLCHVLGCDLVAISHIYTEGRAQLKAIAYSTRAATAIDHALPSLQWEDTSRSPDRQAQAFDPLSWANLPADVQQWLQIDQMHDGIVAPLVCEGHRWGNLIGFRQAHSRPWPSNAIDVFEQIAAQVALGVNLFQLKQQLQQEQNQRQQTDQLLSHIRAFDLLTGLPSRQQVLQVLSQAMQVSDLAPQSIGVALLNIDRFQAINNTLGHKVGDQLLMDFGRRLRQQLDPELLVSHWGGDEFAVLLPSMANPETAMVVANRLQSILEHPFEADQTEVFLTACIGFALNQPSHNTPEQIIQDAETALHHAKSHGIAKIFGFHATMHDQMVARLQLEIALRKALERQEFLLVYQPIFSLSQGHLVGFEALVRWQHPSLGLVSPADFIPLAEETGLVVALDKWGLQTACKQMRQWQDRWPSLPALTMSVNLSSRHFSQPNLAQHVQAHLDAAGVTADRLKLEITESTLIENMALANSVLAELQQFGVQVSLDDFGTGYSSLNYLHQFQLNTLKVDQSFIAALEASSEKTAIVQAIITLAHALGMNVVAEGVETLAQQQILTAMQCEYGQGYLFAKPLTVKDATHLIEQKFFAK
ncbi:MAG: GGDEF domain-containing response regulator [Leptolyngbya sp.]|nr:MAG: GGDEF domain-containing response regulator [Leptolyngbya sp.]